jgi:DNA/RNA endonuclease G (NUC1)
LKEVGNPGNVKTQTIFLQDAVGPYDLGYNEADTYRLGYARTGFETFHIDGLDSLRGKVATLEFKVNGGTVYLDDVFFKSESLRLGNPSNARSGSSNIDTKNYLVERPQYSLAYDGLTKGPKWVAWDLNRSWQGDVSTPEAPWVTAPSSYPGAPNIDTLDYPWKPDSSLPTDIPSPNASRYRTFSWTPSYDRGHLAARADRSRSLKDVLATYFTTNALPMESSFNRFGVWSKLETFTRQLVKQKGWELHIIAGGIGSDNEDINPAHPLNRDYTTNTLDPINVPESLWKIIVIQKPGEGPADITIDTPIISVIFPNQKVNQPEDPDAPDLTNWYSVPYISTIKEIESLTNLNFLSNLSLSALEINSIKNRKYSGFTAWQDFSSVGANISANLLAEQNQSYGASSDISFIGEDINLSFAQINTSQIGSIEQRLPQNSAIQNSSTQIYIDQSSFNQISPTQIGLTQIGSIQNAFRQIGLTENSLTQVNLFQHGTNQSSLTQIGLTQVGSNQVDIHEVSPTEVSSDEINTRQLGIGEIASNQVNPPEIPLPSSITLQQFLSSHNFSLQNTTIPTWTEFLTGTTPFNLKIEITDLPTGQLAEANITHFDPTGRPTSGTLTLDTDANGLGWF